MRENTQVNLQFVTEPYFKFSIRYFISYLSCIIFFTSFCILVYLCVPDDMLNANVIRFAFIVSSIFMSIVCSRILCICFSKKKDDEIEILNIDKNTDEIVWYNE